MAADVRTFLGVDGGGTKTDYLLIDESGRILAKHREGSAYYLETGVDSLQAMLIGGIRATLKHAAVEAADLSFAVVGLPAYGEDSAFVERLDRMASPALTAAQYRCVDDMVCGWAGALAGRDGISVVAGVLFRRNVSNGRINAQTLQTALRGSDRSYEFTTPRLSPSAGAALYAAKLKGTPLTQEAVAALARTEAAVLRTSEAE